MQQPTAFIFSLALWLFSPFNADACSCGTCESVDDARRHYGIFLHLAQAEILASYPIPNDGHHDETKIELAPIRQLIVKPVKRFALTTQFTDFTGAISLTAFSEAA